MDHILRIIFYIHFWKGEIFILIPISLIFDQIVNRWSSSLIYKVLKIKIFLLLSLYDVKQREKRHIHIVCSYWLKVKQGRDLKHTDSFEILPQTLDLWNVAHVHIYKMAGLIFGKIKSSDKLGILNVDKCFKCEKLIKASAYMRLYVLNWIGIQQIITYRTLLI